MIIKIPVQQPTRLVPTGLTPALGKPRLDPSKCIEKVCGFQELALNQKKKGDCFPSKELKSAY